MARYTLGPGTCHGGWWYEPVITGVADQRPSKVAGLLYLDAFVPDDGDSCWSINNDEQRDWYSRVPVRPGSRSSHSRSSTAAPGPIRSAPSCSAQS
jgi:hypothetical protein